MQAVILAAGIGKRLRPLTNDLPKAMVMVNGKPILEYTLGILPEVIDEIILVVGYQKEKIKGANIWVLPNPSGLNAHYTPTQLSILFSKLKKRADISK